MIKFSDNIEGLDADFGELLYDDYQPRWTPTISIEEAKKLLVNFLDTYGENYMKEDLNFIKRNFHNYYSLYGVDTRLAQLYSLFGCFSKYSDPYIGFANVLQKYFDIKVDILDVASGHYPAFGIIVASRQIELGCGTITLYDPSIVCKDKPAYPNMKIYRDRFDNIPSLSEYSLITSTLPSTITKKIIDKVIGTDQELFLVLCGYNGNGTYYEEFNVGDSVKLYDVITRYATNLCKKRGKGEIIVDYLDKSYNISQPILIYKNK